MKIIFLKTIFYTVLLSFLMAGCASMPRMQDIPLVNTTHTIYVIYRGWHTSIMVDAKNIAAQNKQLTSELNGQLYARIGWGDGDYFTGKNKSTATAAKALIASGYSAVQLLPYDYAPFSEIPADTIVAVKITDAGLQNLITFFNQSIALDAQGKLIHLPASGEATGYFFRSKDHYSVFSNCNTWSGNALRAAGLPVANRLTAEGVFEQAKAVSQVQARQGLFK
jgi:uncharacterized protein (TIGR02117 family)